MFDGLFDLFCGKLNGCCLQLAYVSVCYSVGFASCVLDGVGELFVKGVCYLGGCGGSLFVECNGVVGRLCRFFVCQSVYCAPECVRVVSVIPWCV